jgi:hypothetical protein
MQCSSCGFENTSSSVYCEQCGTLLNVPRSIFDQTELSTPQIEYYSQYNAPPPPPLNGHGTLTPPPPPPPLEYSSYTAQSQIFLNAQVISRPGIGIFSAILYFVGALVAVFGLIGTIATFSSSTGTGGIALLLGVALLIASIVVFIRIRRRFPLLRWWQRLLWILGAAVVGFVAIVIETIIAPGPVVTNYFIGCIFMLYGLAWAAIAIW